MVSKRKNRNLPLIDNNEYWRDKLIKKAHELGHTFLEVEALENGRINRDCKVTIHCNKCNKTFESSRARSYCQATVGCPTCIARNPNIPFSLPLPEDQKIRALLSRRKTIEAQRAAIIQQIHIEPDLLEKKKKSVDGVMPEWKSTIHQYYEGCCYVTNEKATPEDPLEIHHLYSRDVYPHLKNDLRNGVLIKRSIHAEFHQVYGGGNNTPQQFEEFVQTRYNKTNFPWKTAEFDTLAKQLFKKALSSPKYYQIEFEKVVQSRGHVVIQYHEETGTYKNKHTLITVQCIKCENGVQETKTVAAYKRSSCGLSCCASKVVSENRMATIKKIKQVHPKVNPSKTTLESFTKMNEQNFLNLIQQNGHVFHGYADGTGYVNYYTQILVECPIHAPGEIVVRSVKNYKRGACGLICCSRDTGNEKRRDKSLLHKEQLSEFLKEDTSSLDAS